ncbi:hypothetical protein [Bacillus pakistanensis]|uniref:hypothetical protein n=1 Tax=Rossellomorea pakistanensis TaxID=992288 RepID=UPI00196470E9|nr:hypothetical protein [Bacillus pakistanensis]
MLFYAVKNRKSENNDMNSAFDDVKNLENVLGWTLPALLAAVIRYVSDYKREEMVYRAGV